MPATGEPGGAWEPLPSRILIATEQLPVNISQRGLVEAMVLWPRGSPATTLLALI